jgi:hypothetical protein
VSANGQPQSAKGSKVAQLHKRIGELIRQVRWLDGKTARYLDVVRAAQAWRRSRTDEELERAECDLANAIDAYERGESEAPRG